MKTYTKRCISLFLTVVMLISCMLTATTNVYAETPGDVGVVLDGDDAEIQYRSRSKIYTISREELSEPWILYDTKYGTEHLGMRTTHTALHNADEMDAMYSRCIHKQEIVNKYINGYTNQYFYATVAEFNAMDKGAGYSPDGKTYYRYTYCTTINNYADYYYFMWSDWSDWGSTPVTPDDDIEVETRKIYTINYDANGGSGVPNSQIKIKGEDLILSDTIPLRDDYVFLGWSTSLTGEAEYSAGAVYSANAKATLYAVWKHKSEFETIKTYYRYRRKTHTTSTKKLDYPWILYDSKIEYKHTNFASVIKTSGYYGAGTLCIHEEIPIQRYVNDYDPLDWFYATHDEFSELIKKDPSMVFKYGADLEDYTKYIYCTSTEPYEIYYYYSWGEWSDWSETPITATDDREVETKIIPLFSISYDANGGIGAPDSIVKEFDETITLSTIIPTREDHLFLGWSTSPNGKVEYAPGAEYSANLDVVLYAVWHTHIYDNSCDVGCNDCDHIREITHTYDNNCDTSCNICGYLRAIMHTYSSECDRDCNVCDEIRINIPHTFTMECSCICSLCGTTRESVIKHTYTNSCDTICNVCNEERTIEHTFSNSCDTDCNVCGEIRKVMHSFTDNCDGECNVCFDTRIPPHCYENACDSVCDGCEKKRIVPDHTYNAVVTAPTCTEQGYTTYACTECGNSYIDNYVDANGHKFDNACDTDCNNCDYKRDITHDYIYEYVEPTCIDAGYTKLICIVCGGVWRNYYVPSMGHIYDNSCDAECNVCGEVRSVSKHIYNAVIVSPTCTEKGYTTYTCIECGDSYFDNYVDANGHRFANACDTKCNNCDYIRDINHTESDWITDSNPTCTIDGSKHKECTVCGVPLETESIDALGHNEISHDAKAPTCTEIGWNSYVTCDRCDYSTYKEIAASGIHNYACVVTAPTCTEQGYTTYTCNECGNSYIDNYTDSKGHTFNNACDTTCNSCAYIRETNHLYSNDIILCDPTCGKNGSIYKVCTVCGDSFIETIPATGEHNYIALVIEPTCTTKGYSVYTCSGCSDEYIKDFVEAKGHTFENDCDTTCNSCDFTREITHIYSEWINHDGNQHIKICECGDYIYADHCWDSGIVTKEPTHITTGIMTHTCSVCNAEKTVDIAKQKHEFSEWTNVSDTQHSRICECGTVETEAHNWDDGIITVQPTIDIHGEKTYTCCDCLATKTEQLSKILPIASGLCGDKLSWMLYESGLLRICGTGLMYNNTITTSFWYEYKSQIKTVEITEGVSSIGDYAFYYCTNLTQINLPDSIVAIGNGAFYDCRALKSIVIPSGVDAIGNFVFRSCIALTNVTIPDSVTSIGQYAFYYCTRLSNIVLPSNVTYIGEYSFGECRFNSITLPDSLTSIGKCAFYKCTNLSWITFTSSVNYIGSYAFDSCNNLNTVVYCGNKTQWDAINFGKGNSTLVNATREYHNWQDATCTAAKRCLLCNIEEGDPLHNWNDGTITVQATHTSYGECTYTCKDCFTTKTEQIDKTANHSYTVWMGVDDEAHKRTCACGDIETESHSWSDWQIIQDSSCVDFGSKYKVCGVCGYTITKSIEPTGVHSYNGVVKKPTCTYQGYTTYTCGVCGDSYIADYVDMVAHIPGDWEQSVAPKCEDEGEDIKKCTVCETIVDTRIVDATGHDFDNWYVSIEPKFHVDGQERRNCKNCDHFETKRIPKFSESHVCDYTGREEIVENPTCTEDGNKRVYCTEIECGKHVIVVLDATGHTEGNWEIKTQPTCTEYGTEVKRCTICKTELLSRPIDPTGHKYDNDCDAICNVCESVREVPDHIYDNTCDTSCNECGAVRTITHTYSNNCDADCNVCGFVRVPSDHVYDNICDTSCNECGDVREITHTYSNNCDTSCNVCGFLRDVPDHLYDKTVVQPTCTSQGYTVYTCYVCGYEYKGDYVNALGHSYSDDFDATCNNCDFVRDAKKHGDTNNDGEINNKDCALLIQYTNGWNVQIDVTAADVNADGKINNKDYVLLMRYINGWDVELK